jgi:hypothetical protein
MDLNMFGATSQIVGLCVSEHAGQFRLKNRGHRATRTSQNEYTSACAGTLFNIAGLKSEL